MKRIFYLLTLCFFGLTAFQEPDKTCDTAKVTNEGKVPTPRSLSATPKAFFDLANLDLLSQKLEEVSLSRTPTSTPTSLGAQTNSFSLAIQREIGAARRQQERKIRAAICSITAQEKMRTPNEEPVTGIRMRDGSVSTEDAGSPVSPAKRKARYSSPDEARDASSVEPKPE